MFLARRYQVKVEAVRMGATGGNIPEAFLRGCGVPDEFITFLPSVIGAQQAIQFYSCFISYGTKDEEFTKRLHSR